MMSKYHSFCGLFLYSNLETEACDGSIYFSDVHLSVPMGNLPVGFHVDEAYVSLEGKLLLVESWKNDPECDVHKGNCKSCLIPGASHEFQLSNLNKLDRNWEHSLP